MHEHTHDAAAVLRDALCERVDDLTALLVIGGIDVQEERLASRLTDRRGDLVDVLHAGAAIEMHAAHVEAARREHPRGGLAETTRGTEDEGPALRRLHHGDGTIEDATKPDNHLVSLRFRQTLC
jgi:hypothetical protein